MYDSKFVDKPFVKSVFLEKLDSCCSSCLKVYPPGAPKRPKRCVRCKSTYYCNPECQKTDWADHQNECKAFRAGVDLSGIMTKLLLRTVYKLHRISTGIEPQVQNPLNRTFKHLVSHSDKVSPDTFERVAKILTSFIPEEVYGSKEELFETYCKLCVNSTGDDFYASVHILFSALDHSCKPNGRVAPESHSIIPVHSKTPIPLDFTQIRLSYMDNWFRTTVERRARLRQMYFFECQCEFCTDRKRDAKMRAFCCTQMGCDGAVLWSLDDLENDSANVVLKCEKCDSERPRETIMEYASAHQRFLALQENLSMNTTIDSTNWTECRKLYEESKSVLHRENGLRAEILQFLVHSCAQIRDDSIDADCLNLARQLLPLYEKYVPDLHSDFGEFLQHLARLELRNSNFSKAVEHHLKAREIWFLSREEPEAVAKDRAKYLQSPAAYEEWLRLATSTAAPEPIQKSIAGITLIYGIHLLM